MAGKKGDTSSAPEATSLRVRLEDPVDTLVDAFNTRTQDIVDTVDRLDKNYQSQLSDIKDQLKTSAATFNRIMIAVIVVLSVGFITLLVAVVAVIITSMQFGGETYREQQQNDGIQKLKDQQDKTHSMLETIQSNTKPKQ
jgi:hypothetical protein